MNIRIRLFIFWLLILSACASPVVNVAPSTQTSIRPIVSITTTSQPTNQVQSSRTTQPSKTPTTTPSVTPTFNVKSVITLTPAAAEKCPASANVPIPDLSVDPNSNSFLFFPYEKRVLEFLNSGGNPSDLLVKLRQTWKRTEVFTKNEVIKDLTDDGVPEILIIPSELFIIGCVGGKFQTLMMHQNEAPGFNGIEQQLVDIQDLNLNGIPEVVFASFGCGGMGAGQCLDVYIYEWNGTEFKTLIPIWEGYEVGVSMVGGRLTEYLPDSKLQDIDNNGTLELILTGDIPNSWYLEYFMHQPWRDKSEIYMWNGQHFVLYKTEFSTPTYRYQAIQDGDRATLHNEYEKALALYQDAIFSDNLLGWSSAHKERFTSLHQYNWDPDFQLTPTPVIPYDDPKEYPNLAAYARYRIMLLHVLQGNLPEAKVVFDTLQENFPMGSPGHEFALMAKAFWEEYQINSNLDAACQKAIIYATSRLGILNILGGDYHNSWQDITYQPNDICPFK